MIGIDYNKANVDIRAMFSFLKRNATAAMERLEENPGDPGVCHPVHLQPYGTVGEHERTGTELC